MNTLALSLKEPIPLTLVLGIFGGIGLILASVMTTIGPAIFIPYAVLVIAIFAALRLADLPNLVQRFSTEFLAFMLATVIMYFFIVTIEAGTLTIIPWWGHVGRLGFMAIIGGSLSLNAAVLADVGSKPVSTAFLALMLAGLAIILAPAIGTMANILVPEFWPIMLIGFLAMIVGSLGLNVICLIDIGRKHKA